MANEKTPVVWDDTTNKHRPLGTGEKMGGLDASSILSSDAGNLITSGSDGLAYLSGSGMVDPRADNLLEESDQGKLQVTVDRIAEWLDGHPQDAAALADAMNVVSADAGNIIVQGTDKGAYLSNAQLAAAFAGLTDAQKAAIAAAVAEKMAAQLADGKTIVASGGKLTADPTNATAAQKKAINQALADADSGLVVDNSTGKLKVDFSNMPTDKFEALLRGLNMLVPLTEDMQLYVSTTADGDSIVDGRGTQAKPFRHIQACVDYATETYSIGRYSIFINVAAGTYDESVSLPEFSHGTGRIVIRPVSGSRDVEVASAVNAAGTRGWCFTASGGAWSLQNLILSRVENPTTARNVTVGCLMASGGAIVGLSGISFRQSFPASPSPIGGNSYQCRLVWVGGGANVEFSHGGTAHAFSSQTGTGVGVTCIHASNTGRVTLSLTPSDGVSHNVECSGSFNTFAVATGNGMFVNSGSGHRLVFNGAGCEGKRYEVTNGSSINTGGGGASYFPGDSAGTVEDATYCWYA